MRSSSQIRQTNFAQNERNFSASSETVCSLERKFSSVAASISLAVGEKIRSVRANFFRGLGTDVGRSRMRKTSLDRAKIFARWSRHFARGRRKSSLGSSEFVGPKCEKFARFERNLSHVGADVSLAGGEKIRSVRANLSVPRCEFFCSNRANFSHVGGDISLAGGEKFCSNRATFSHVGANISLARAKNVGHFELIISLGMRNHSLARSNDAARCGVDRIICSVAKSLCTHTHAFNTCNAPAGTVAR